MAGLVFRPRGDLDASSRGTFIIISHDDLIILIDFMAGDDYSVGELADAVAKPWKYADVLTVAKAALTGREQP